MFRTVMWVAAACAAVLLALFVSRTLHFDRPAPPAKPPEAPAAPVAAKPAAAVAPVVPPPAPPPPPPTPEEEQVQDDAAATGMTTVDGTAPHARRRTIPQTLLTLRGTMGW